MTITKNPASVVDEESLSVSRRIRIAAPIEKVWAAITEPEHVSRWFGRLELDGSGVGAEGTITWDDHGSIPIAVEAIDPLRSIAYRWTNDDAADGQPARVAPDRSTRFVFTVTPVGDATDLEVVETGFGTTSDPAGNLASHARGWVEELDELVALLESGA